MAFIQLPLQKADKVADQLWEVVYVDLRPWIRQSCGGQLIAPGSASDPQVDAARMEGLQHSKLLGHLQRRVVGKRAVELDPGSGFGHGVLATAYFIAGKEEAAVDARLISYRHRGLPEQTIAGLRRAYGEGGIRGFLRAELDGAKELSATRYVSPYGLARLHSQLGEVDQAFEQLERAYEQHDTMLVYLNLGLAQELYSDPRMNDLVRRMGLPGDG